MPASYSESLARRRQLIGDDTNAFRVIDGVGDGYSGVFVDRLADRVLVSTRDCAIPAALASELGGLGVPVFHKRLDRRDKEAPEQVGGPLDSLRFEVVEQGVRLMMDMQAGYSQGLFLDQRDNRRRVRERSKPGDRILNTFSYTGAFSVYAALGGAVTTTLDLAQPCLDWARENFSLNGMEPSSHYFCKGDTFHWLERFARQKRLFNGVVLDPPTFSRNESGKVFRVEDDYGELVDLARSCLAPGGWILCTTNCRGLNGGAFREMVVAAAPGAEVVEYAMPDDFSGEQYLKTVWLNF